MENLTTKSLKGSLFHVIIIAFVWQFIPLLWLNNSFTQNTFSVKALIFHLIIWLVVPLVAARVHNSWKVGVACICLVGFSLLQPWVYYTFIGYSHTCFLIAVIILVVYKLKSVEIDRKYYQLMGKTESSHDSNGRAVSLSFAWMAIPGYWITFGDLFDSRLLMLLVFLGVPVIAGMVHKSWKTAIACLLLPVFTTGVFFIGYALILPRGKW